MEASSARAPNLSTVAVEQLKVVGLAVRRETILAGLALVLVLVVLPGLEGVSSDDLDPGDLGILAWMAGLAYPLIVWKGESGFGESEMWSLPFDHSWHARLKVVAGWVWLMAFIAFGVLVISLFILFIGGSLGLEQARLVATDPAGAREGLSEAITTVQWSTPSWHWILPFTSATGAYLATSILFVGTRRPLRWAAGVWIVVILWGSLTEGGPSWVVAADALDTFATGGSEPVFHDVLLESGERANVWWRLPTFGAWASTMFASLVVVLSGTWLASARHREG